METIPLNGAGRIPSASYSGNHASISAVQVGGDDNLLEEDDKFSCNICFDSVKDPVVTQCGHLYCWPCLFRWLKTQHATCPVCKSGVTEENVIPIYIRGADQVDPRLRSSDSQVSASGEVPNRPQGRRIDAMTQNVVGPGNIPNNPFGGTTITTSYGYFPSLFGLQFQNFTPSVNRPITADDDSERKYLSRALYVLGGVVVLSLVLF